MRSSDRLVGSPSRQCVEQFREARLVRITHGGFAIWLYPFGMLDPQFVVNLLPELVVGVDLVKHGNWLGEKIQVRRGTITANARRNRRLAMALRARANSQVRLFHKTARACLRCALRWANWITL
jgi:hypothetical protein